jgi:hypothetical protein
MDDKASPRWEPVAVKLLLAAAALFLGAASPAAADSIVYAKQGNLFLTTADGSAGYQLTSDGGYSSPSQADDGTIGAIRDKYLVRLDRSGRALNDPVAAMGTLRGPIAGPYEARLSPDGRRFAYYFYVQSSFDDASTGIRWIDTGSYATWSWADRFTGAAADSEFDRSLKQPEWVSNDRVLGTQGFSMNMWTWKVGTGTGYTYTAQQWWFGLHDPVDEWGVHAAHWYDDPALSRDGAKLAMTDAGQQLVIAATNGPAWSGEPPYPEPDYLSSDSGFAEPAITCRGPVGKTENPTWSADGSTLAYGGPDGVHVINADCTGDRLLVPGATEPAFGPAGVNPPAAAQSPVTAPVARPAPVKLSRVSLHPRAFSARKGTTVRFTLSAPASVRITSKRSKPRTINGRAGSNAVRVHPRRGARRLTLTVDGKRASVTFRVRA